MEYDRLGPVWALQLACEWEPQWVCVWVQRSGDLMASLWECGLVEEWGHWLECWTACEWEYEWVRRLARSSCHLVQLVPQYRSANELV